MHSFSCSGTIINCRLRTKNNSSTSLNIILFFNNKQWWQWLIESSIFTCICSLWWIPYTPQNVLYFFFAAVSVPSSVTLNMLSHCGKCVCVCVFAIAHMWTWFTEQAMNTTMTINIISNEWFGWKHHPGKLCLITCTRHTRL